MAHHLVLVVDDDPAVRDVVEQVLLSEGFEVITADSLSAVARLLDGGPLPPLAIVDQHLPDGLGSDLCRRLKERDPRVFCLVFSGDPAAATRAFAAGADRWLSKPFDLADLLRSISGFSTQADHT